MQSTHRGIFIIVAAALLLAGCALPGAISTPTAAPGDYSATLAAIQTRTVQTAAAQGIGAASTVTPTLPPQTTAQPNPVVVNDALCWRGPGPDYEVISSILKSTSVSLLGRGAIAGWFVLRNPVYGDPCWMQANNLQLPPGFDVSVLPVYNPPFTATPTPSPTPLVSATPTGSSTPAPSPGVTPTP